MTEAEGPTGNDAAKIVSLSERARKNRRTETGPDSPRGMEEPTDLAREVMFRRLADLADELDPVPPDVADDAKASYSWRSVDDELARLTYDSALDPDLRAGVRAGGGFGRQLTFEAAHLVLEIEIADGHHRALTCQVVPPQPAELEVRHRGGTVPLGQDGYGTFHLPDLPEGPVSIRCIPMDARVGSTATSWVTF